MKENKMVQKSGDNSNQYQIENYYEGVSGAEIEIIITEVRNIITEENKLLLENMKIVAAETAQQRLNNYTEVLIPRLVKSELLTAFSEPAVQVLFKSSEKTAICTERKTDYEMLSELIIHRINTKEDYTISAAISKAINEVNNISEQAMMTLTLLFSITTYTPSTGDIREGFKTLDDLYGHLLEFFNLPTDDNWRENLEIVNALRIIPIGKSKTLEDFLFDSLEGYSLLGFEKDNEALKKAIEKLNEVGLSDEILVPSDLDPNYVRLEISKESSIDKLRIVNNDSEEIKSVELNSSQRKVLHDIFNEYNNIKTVMNWWNDNITKFSFQITAIGRVLACTNAVRIDNSLPNIIIDTNNNQ